MEDEVAFKKWDNNEKNLIVPFTGNRGARNNMEASKIIFEFSRSLSNMNLSCDVMFMIDITRKWYLGGLKGIGKNFDHTLAFLKREIQNYDKVIFMGASAGGYASILFGSLLKVDAVIAWWPQTDLDHVLKKIKNARLDEPICSPKLHKLKTFKKYNNLNTVINSTTQYFINTKRGRDAFHGRAHYNNISEFSNVNPKLGKAKKIIKTGELEKLLKSLLSSDM